MAEYEMKDNTFALFRNKNKEKESQPDYQGDIMVEGKKLRLSAWLQESKAGSKYIKGQVQEPWDGKGGKKKEDRDDF